MKTQHTLRAALGCLCLLTTALPAQVPNLLNYQGRIAVGTASPVNFDGMGFFKFALVDGGTNPSVQATGTATRTGSFITAHTVTNPGSGYTFPPAVTVSGGGGTGATATAVLSGGSVVSITPGLAGSGYTSTPTVAIALPPTTYARTFWSNNGTSAAGSQPTAAVSLMVTKGLYSVLLGDASPPLGMAPIPASVFANPDVRLRVWFSDNVNGFQQLTPDQRIASVGYAMMADSVRDGAISAAQLAPGALFSTVATSAATTTAAPNTAYTATGAGAGPQTIFLPTTAAVGDVVTIAGQGTAGWKVVAGSGQSVTGIDPALDWTPRDSNRGWYSVASSADGTKLVAAALGGQIYTSTDSGVTWTPRESNRPWRSVASSTDGTKLVAAASFGQIYTSTDSGVNWTPRESDREWFSVASSADGVKLVATVLGGQIYTSTDSGVNWTSRESNRYWVSVASSADGTKLVAVLGGGQIYTSTDSGVNWAPRESDRDWASVASSADGTKLVAVVQGGQIYTSPDSGANWTPRESDRNWSSVASSADGTNLVAAALSGQIYTSPDSGVTWTPRESNRAWQSVASSADGTKLVAAVSGGKIYTPSGRTGGADESGTFRYLGNGQWTAVHDASLQQYVNKRGDTMTGSLTVNGTVTATAFSGNGAGLTNLPGSAMATAPPGMVLIPAGPFTMGNSVAADTDITNAAPVTTTVSAFYMDVNEVTLSQWNSVRLWAYLYGYNFFQGAGKAPNHPVHSVSWYDCVKWCNARSEREGRTPVYYTDDAQTTVYRTGNVNVTNAQVKWTANGYRLPTEAEWEKAARGGLSGLRFPWGAAIDGTLGNYYGFTGTPSYDFGPDGYNVIGSVGGTNPATSPVGSFAANGYGLNDMAGNLFEWCWDWYGTPYAGGSDPYGPASGSYRVSRGGSWTSFARFARCAFRNDPLPTETSSGNGLRTVLSPSQP